MSIDSDVLSPHESDLVRTGSKSALKILVSQFIEEDNRRASGKIR